MGILTCIFPFIKNKTDTETAMEYWELNISSWKEIQHSQYDSQTLNFVRVPKPVRQLVIISQFPLKWKIVKLKHKVIHVTGCLL